MHSAHAQKLYSASNGIINTSEQIEKKAQLKMIMWLKYTIK